MRKSPSALILLALLIAILAVTLSNIKPAIVEALPPTSSLAVQVEHGVQIRDGGLIVINDAVNLSIQPGQAAENVQNFTLGFPFGYQSDLEYVYAYPTSNPNSRLTVDLDTGIGKIGFYGVNVKLNATSPEDSVSISAGTPYRFSVVFVFSNLISFQSSGNETLFNATFPGYPSLPENASTVNLEISFPINAQYTNSSFETQGVKFQNATEGSFKVFSNVKKNLTEFTDEASWFLFSAPTAAFKIMEASEIQRNIKLNDFGPIQVSDNYHITCESSDLPNVTIQVPSGAYQVSVWDVLLGQIPSGNVIQHGSNVTIIFSPATSQGAEEVFTVNYLLPWKDYVDTQTWSSFQVNLTLFENNEWIIRELTTTITLPEGAATLQLREALDLLEERLMLLTPPLKNLCNLESNAYQTTLTLVFYNATPFQNLTFNFTYGYTIFWESFQPVLWIGVIVTILAAVTILWRVQKPAVAVPTITIYPKELKSFIDAYEEKRKTTSELESIEKRAQKGKIPRREYKVRRRTLESRISVLSRDLATLREKIRTAGPRYSDMMRQIEVAETELQGVEADIIRTEVRYRRGEIAASAYHKLLEDSYKRREKAKFTIDGVLLRLREEIT